LLSERRLSGGFSRDPLYLLLILLSIQLDKRIKSKVFSLYFQLLTNHVVDFVPVFTLQFLVPKSYNDWHGSLEGIHEHLEFLSDRIRR